MLKRLSSASNKLSQLPTGNDNNPTCTNQEGEEDAFLSNSEESEMQQRV
jgi:hypothetical protein